MSSFADQIGATIHERGLLSAGETIVVAVSGGLDSMTLLDVLHELATAEQWSLVVAHFNHQLRGNQSDGDEELVRRTAAKLGIGFKAGRADVAALAKRSGLSIEVAARQARHRFLARVAAQQGKAKVALAHHSDDQLELFFLRLLRGTGPEGLVGMRFVSPSPADPRVHLIRPLLGVTRREIAAAARQRRVQYRVDASNAHMDFERNRVRHKLLPGLRRQFRAGFEKNVLRLMDILAAESDFVAAETRQAFERPKARPFEEHHTAIQRRLLRSQCLAHGIAADFQIIELLRATAGQVVTVDPQRAIWRDSAGQVHFHDQAEARFRSRRKRIDLARTESTTVFAGLQFTWKIEPWRGWRGAEPHLPMRERFDADQVGSPVRLRHWRPGDRFRPIGLSAEVKLQNLFVNLKINRERRRELVIGEASSGEIFWVEGLRIAERFKIQETTRRCLDWRWAPFRG